MSTSAHIEMINKMKAGIEHQAKTNADAMREQAMQDAESFRSKKVYQAKIKISADADLEEKAIRSQKAVQISVVNGIQRKKLLNSRQEAIDKAMVKAEEKLAEYTKTKDYDETLYKLCLEGLMALGDPVVALAVRECDAEKVKGFISKLADEYKSKSQKDVALSLSDYVVDDACIGGVVLISNNGTVQMSNTLKDRLHLACTDLYPKIRTILLD